jgi:serpin B
MASWAREFGPEDTTEGAFTALDGSTATVPFMRQPLRTPYASFAGGEAVELPYVGGDVSMVLIRPDEGAFESLERSLTAGELFGVFEELSDARDDLALPRFEVETGVTLSEPLSALGMPAAWATRTSAE